MENTTEQRVHSEAAVLDLLSRGSNVRAKGETQVQQDCQTSPPVPASLHLSASRVPILGFDRACNLGSAFVADRLINCGVQTRLFLYTLYPAASAYKLPACFSPAFFWPCLRPSRSRLSVLSPVWLAFSRHLPRSFPLSVHHGAIR